MINYVKTTLWNPSVKLRTGKTHRLVGPPTRLGYNNLVSRAGGSRRGWSWVVTHLREVSSSLCEVTKGWSAEFIGHFSLCELVWTWDLADLWNVTSRHPKFCSDPSRHLVSQDFTSQVDCVVLWKPIAQDAFHSSQWRLQGNPFLSVSNKKPLKVLFSHTFFNEKLKSDL